MSVAIVRNYDMTYNNNHTPLFISENDLTQNAVAIALTEENDIIFEERSKTITHQPGDICLPGGRVEPGDTPEEAALREITEELLIDPSQIEIITPVSIFMTGGLEIHVFLCRIHDYKDTYQTDEVASILRVPLPFFLAKNRKSTRLTGNRSCPMISPSTGSTVEKTTHGEKR